MASSEATCSIGCIRWRNGQKKISMVTGGG
ncbi:uncharacterized protein METZ01_LOCUS337425 [marine metagenome]|uniref:Uncharacterized protein n=1 Tax=marine metagenome TaxID=408172 RepID=A0A382QJW9_9ZZZZ